MPQRRARGPCPAKIVGACYAASMDLSLTTPAATDQRGGRFMLWARNSPNFRRRATRTGAYHVPTNGAVSAFL